MTKLNITTAQEPTSVILGGSGKRVFDGMKVGLIKINSQDPVKFSQAELTFIRKLMLVAEEAMNEEQEYLTELREKLWQQCDKEDVSTSSEFKTLNKVKTEIKKIRKLKRTIVSINQKVKKQTKQLQ